MAYSLQHLATVLSATLVGDPNIAVTRVVHPRQAQSAEDLALILEAVILPDDPAALPKTALLPLDLAVSGIPNQLKVPRPKVALATLLTLFEQPVHIPPGIHPTAVIDSTARVAPDAVIGPYCVIGPGSTVGAGTRMVAHVCVGREATIGDNVLLHAGSVVGDRVRLGNRVILQPNAVIGSDGFSYVTPEAGSVESIRQTGEIQAQNTGILRINSIGTVVLEDDVEIGANACVDRATLGETRIGRGTKIDNQVQIGHNVTMGENCLLAGQAGVAGSVRIGNRVVLGGQVGVRDHVTIGDDTVVVAKSGVTADVPEKTILMGLQGMPRKEFLTREVKMHRLFRLPEQLKDLEARLDTVEAQGNEKTPQPV